MKILVVGAAGFIGSNICHRLSEMNIEYLAIDNMQFGDSDNLPANCNVLFKDFDDVSDEIINQYDVLVHVACSNIIYSMQYPIETVINNSVKGIKLFSRFNGKIIYTSTASVYGNSQTIPTKETDRIQLSNGYDTSKYILELFLRERGNFTTLRLSNVYGRFQNIKNPYCGVLGKFIDMFISGLAFQVYGDGSATRDYTYIDDVIDAILLAIRIEPLNTEINIATGIETSINDIARIIDDKNLIVNMPSRSIDKILRRCLNTEKAKSILGWSAKTSIKEGIDKTKSYKKQESVFKLTS